MGSSKPATSTTIENHDPWAPTQNDLIDITNISKNLYNSGAGAQVYGGERYAGLGDTTQAGIGLLKQNATTSAATNAGTNFANGLLSNGGLSSGSADSLGWLKGIGDADTSGLKGAVDGSATDLSSYRSALDNTDADLTGLRYAAANQSASLGGLKRAVANGSASLSGLQSAVNNSVADTSGVRSAVDNGAADLTGLRSSVAALNAGDSYTKTNLGGVARGDYLDPSKGNPYLDDLINQSATDAAHQVAAQYAATGRYGSGSFARATADATGKIATQTRAAEYDSERARQVEANQLIDSTDLSRNQARASGESSIASADLANRNARTVGEQSLFADDRANRDAYGNAQQALFSGDSQNRARQVTGQQAILAGDQSNRAAMLAGQQSVVSADNTNKTRELAGEQTYAQLDGANRERMISGQQGLLSADMANKAAETGRATTSLGAYQNASQLSAGLLSQLPMLEQLRQQPAQTLLAAGGIEDMDRQAKDDAAQTVWQEKDEAPLRALGLYQSVIQPIAGLGGSSVSTTRSTPAQSSIGQQLLGGGIGLLGALGKTGVFGTSDMRAKDDITPVGQLPNGLGLYSYSMKPEFGGDPQVGVLAQEVEQTNPGAVMTGPDGVKKVDYAAATDGAMAAPLTLPPAKLAEFGGAPPALPPMAAGGTGPDMPGASTTRVGALPAAAAAAKRPAGEWDDLGKFGVGLLGSGAGSGAAAASRSAPMRSGGSQFDMQRFSGLLNKRAA